MCYCEYGAVGKFVPNRILDKQVGPINKIIAKVNSNVMVNAKVLLYITYDPHWRWLRQAPKYDFVSELHELSRRVVFDQH